MGLTISFYIENEGDISVGEYPFSEMVQLVFPDKRVMTNCFYDEMIESFSYWLEEWYGHTTPCKIFVGSLEHDAWLNRERNKTEIQAMVYELANKRDMKNFL